MADRSIILRLKAEEGRAMIAGLLLVAGIFVAFQGGGWLLLGLILIAAGLGHALMGRDPR